MKSLVTGQIASFFIYVLEISSETRSYTTLFRGRVDADKDKVSLLDTLVNVG